MAQRRMFSPDIVKSDEFMTMPTSSQALYFHLGMDADDDGFVQPKPVMREVGFQDDDLKVLLAKRFILSFESGVVVIKHWLIHNMIRSDRYKPTRFSFEKHGLLIKDNKAYTEKEGVGCHIDTQMAPQVRLGKVSNDDSFLQKESDLQAIPDSNADTDTVVDNNIDEDGNEVTVGKWGRPLKTGSKVAKEGKNKVALRVQYKFIELCVKNVGTSPVANVVGYKLALRALNTGGLTEEQIYDLFDEWFTLGYPDEQTISIGRALSDNQVNAYKVRNQV